MVLIDTNVLLRLAEPGHAHHAQALGAIEQLGHTDPLVIVPQNLYEFWSVATRPVDANGLGRTTAQADAEIEGLLSLFALLKDERAIFQPWRELVLTHDVKGRKSFDTRLVAAMQRHAITKILTFNDQDFTSYKHITVLKPDEIVGTA